MEELRRLSCFVVLLVLLVDKTRAFNFTFLNIENITDSEGPFYNQDGTDRDGQPVFTVQPESLSYIVNQKSISIDCTAAFATAINFKCLSRWMDRALVSSRHLVDPSTRIDHMQNIYRITKDDVEMNDFWCECSATNDGTRHVLSQRGYIKIAKIRSQFVREPISLTVASGKQVELDCLAPEGTPQPTVFWEKNGQRIDVKKEINYIISHSGSLIINQASLTDIGNYTCAAENIVATRRSKPAHLSVFVSGAWSAWTSWSTCSNECGKGFKRRSRTCTNPAPQNNGRTCPGQANQRTSCTTTCQVDGQWSDWSSWSKCGADCKHHKRRLCNRPAPQHGGLYCRGNDLVTTNCSGGTCPAGSGDGLQHEAKEASLPNNIWLYVGLGGAGFVLIVVILLVIFLVRRRKRQRSMFDTETVTDSYHSDDEKKTIGVNGCLTMQPDITKTVGPVPAQSAFSPVALPTDSLEKVPMLRTNSSGSVAQSSCDKHIYVELPQNGDMLDKLANSKDSDGSLPPYDEVESTERRSIGSVHVPSNIDPDCMAWGMVGYQGGRLTVPGTGVSLTIPEGAVTKGCKEEIFIAVCREDRDRPQVTDKQTILSPVVLLGPHGMSLQKSVVLSFPHCASLKHGQWKATMLCSDVSFTEVPLWKPMVTLGQETIATPVYCQLDNTFSHMLIDNAGKFCLMGESMHACKATKILRLAAFAAPMQPLMDYNLRVYAVEDTPSAIEGVIQMEKKLGGRLVDKPKQIPYQDGGNNLCLLVEDISDGWKSKLQANYQEIPFRHIWSGNQNHLHCAFALEMIASQSTLTCKIQVYQRGTLSNRQSLHIHANLNERLPPSPKLPRNRQQRSSTVTTGSCPSGNVALDPPQNVFRLPGKLRIKLSACLDPPNNRGSDWRKLAQQLEVDRYINYFATKSSPTDCILDLWEARHREETAVTDLMNALRVMGRMDAALILEKEMGAWL